MAVEAAEVIQLSGAYSTKKIAAPRLMGRLMARRDDQHVERVEQLRGDAGQGLVGRVVHEKARLEDLAKAAEQDVGHDGGQKQQHEAGDGREHARGEAVLGPDAASVRVEVDARAGLRGRGSRSGGGLGGGSIHSSSLPSCR